MLMEQRRQLIPRASGDILEIGVGSGLNFQFYDPARVTELTGIEPSATLRSYAARAAKSPRIPLILVDARAESLPFDSGRFDTVVSTFTLCSVADHAKALSELRRVLRPGGTILFCEHGLAPDRSVTFQQKAVEPLWRRAFDGCRLTRPVAQSISQFLSVDSVLARYASGLPRFMGWMELGTGHRA